MLTHFLFTILYKAQSKTIKKHARFIGTIFVPRIPDPHKNIYSDIDRIRCGRTQFYNLSGLSIILIVYGAFKTNYSNIYEIV